MIRDWDLASFDWDAGNERKSWLKHGISRGAIEAFLSSLPAYYEDHRHSSAEKRYIAVGPGPNGRWMFVSFTVRRGLDRLLVRPISARYMHPKEVRRHVSDQESAP